MILADQFLEIIEHDAVVDVDLENIPLAFSLENNYPNPFNPKTTLRFNIPGRTRVNLSIYDVSGRLVATLVDGLVNGGNHEVTWDGRDEGGRPIASGIYFSSLRSDEISLKRKMLLMK